MTAAARTAAAARARWGRLLNVFLPALLLAGLVLTLGLALRSAVWQLTERLEEWRTLTTAGHFLGEADAPVKVVVFTDYQCPFCAELHSLLEEFVRRYTARVAVVVRHFPMTAIHPHAYDAALAVECAAAENRFARFQSLLYAQQDSIGSKPWARLADEAALPVAAFAECLSARVGAARIDADVATARASGVRGTPTMFVHGWKMEGVPCRDRLDRLIRSALEEAASDV